MDKSERYLKEIAKNTADIAKELKRINRNPVSTPTKEELLDDGYRVIHEEKIRQVKEGVN